MPFPPIKHCAAPYGFMLSALPAFSGVVILVVDDQPIVPIVKADPLANKSREPSSFIPVVGSENHWFAGSSLAFSLKIMTRIPQPSLVVPCRKYRIQSPNLSSVRLSHREITHPNRFAVH